MPRATIYKEIRKYLLDLIAKNQTTPNFLLPSEAQLSIRFKCSRLPAKRALNELEQENIIVRIPGRGSLIKNSSTYENLYSKRNICLILPSPHGAFWRDILTGVSEELQQKKAGLFCFFSDDQSANEDFLVDSIFGKMFDALLISPAVHEISNPALEKKIIQKYPLMFVARSPFKIPASCVCCQDKQVIQVALRYLEGQGHTQIGLITEQTEVEDNYRDRIFAYQNARRELKEPERLCVLPVNNSVDWDANISSTVDAFLAQNRDMTALIATGACVAYLTDYSRRQPLPVTAQSLVIIDRPEPGIALPFADGVFLDQSPREMGRIAARKLMEQIETGEGPTQTFLTPEIRRFSANTAHVALNPDLNK